jgi:hypothetical protein
MPCCHFFNCNETEGVHPYHIVHDLYVMLCPGHASLALSARKSTVALIEFLVALKGNDPEYRQAMRNFVIAETMRVIDGR